MSTLLTHLFRETTCLTHASLAHSRWALQTAWWEHQNPLAIFESCFGFKFKFQNLSFAEFQETWEKQLLFAAVQSFLNRWRYPRERWIKKCLGNNCNPIFWRQCFKPSGHNSKVKGHLFSPDSFKISIQVLFIYFFPWCAYTWLCVFGVETTIP